MQIIPLVICAVLGLCLLSPSCTCFAESIRFRQKIKVGLGKSWENDNYLCKYINYD